LGPAVLVVVDGGRGLAGGGGGGSGFARGGSGRVHVRSSACFMYLFLFF